MPGTGSQPMQTNITRDELTKLAEAQGWRVELTKGQRMGFYPPNGGQPIWTTGSPGRESSVPRAMGNLLSSLRRAGLVLPGDSGSAPTDDDRIGVIEAALDAAVEMIHELADQYKRYRDHTEQELMELRGGMNGLREDMATASQAVVTLGKVSASAKNGEATATQALGAAQQVQKGLDEIRDALAALSMRMDEAEESAQAALAKADPIATFRERLRR